MKVYRFAFGSVELTDERLRHIIEFHPEVKSFQRYFADTLKAPDFIKPSTSDPKAFVFYRKITETKLLAVVVKINARHFILTAYITSKPII